MCADHDRREPDAGGDGPPDALGEHAARARWQAELRKHGPRGWHASRLARVMFDWGAADGPTAYRPAPAWPTIVGADGRARLTDYLALQARLIEQGYRFSGAGGARPTTTPGGLITAPRRAPPAAAPDPYPIDFGDVAGVIRRVMSELHPAAVRQEQILRGAFLARLPAPHAAAVGTLRSAVHPEMPTPSATYQRTGTRPMRARYDLGFGAPGGPGNGAGIVGVAELKAGAGSFDQAFSEGLAADVEKLLDPLLPAAAFRISWVTVLGRGRAGPGALRDRVAAFLAPLEARLGRQGGTFAVDPASGWLVRRWASGVAVHLAWYQPASDDPGRFTPAWA